MGTAQPRLKPLLDSGLYYCTFEVYVTATLHTLDVFQESIDHGDTSLDKQQSA
jgi:hypothetical protein